MQCFSNPIGVQTCLTLPVQTAYSRTFFLAQKPFFVPGKSHRSLSSITILSTIVLKYKDLVLVWQKVLGECVDGTYWSQGHRSIAGPNQIGTKDNGKIGRRHLVHITSIDHQGQKFDQKLKHDIILVWQFFYDQITRKRQSALFG